MKPNLPIGGSGVNKARYKQDRAGHHKSSTKAKRTSLLVSFASDSPLEGDGFELPVPREKKSRNLGIPAIGRAASTPSSEKTVSRMVMSLRISIMIFLPFKPRRPNRFRDLSRLYPWISTGPLGEPRNITVHLDPRQRVGTKN